jgi:outer membrane receptor for ferrienterochelin and colicin
MLNYFNMNKYHIRFVFAIIALFFLSQNKTYSQEKIDTTGLFDTSISELLNLEITVASNIVTEVEKQPVSITTISNEELRLAGARTLADAIMVYVPGFFLIEDQDDVIVGFRGLAPDNNSKVLLLINGQNYNTEWFWGPPSAILNSFNFDYIEKIEIIRGPGSVTLGQGALLGVINIVTKSGTEIPSNSRQGSINHMQGLNDFSQTTGEFSIHQKKISNYTYFASSKYNGQLMRNEGWVRDKANEGIRGGKVFDIGTRLKRSNNNQLFTTFNYKNISFSLLYADQEKDLYNFYRDRNVSLQNLIALSTFYRYKFNDKVEVRTSINAAMNSFGLKSIEGNTLGGTSEDNYNAKVIIVFNDLMPKNNLAIGVEYKRFNYGNKNFEGNNFILNTVDTSSSNLLSNYYTVANTQNTWGYKSNLDLTSVIVEDYYALNKVFDVFIAFRFDHHKYWGNNISPRLGLIASANENLNFRLSYQVGFRGAVGLHYGGGYRGDGLLSAENYNLIESAQIPIFNDAGITTGEIEQNIKELEPEKMQSIELGMNYLINKQLNFQTVVFYNLIKNVIDVGVIYKDPSIYILPNIGTDIPGSWNGYWYFKNNLASIQQYGFESILSYRSKYLAANISHSLVMLTDLNEEQASSMYVTPENNIKAYPGNVTRVNLTTFFTHNVKLGINYLYYYSWITPKDKHVDGNHLLSLSSIFDFSKNFSGSFSIINILGQKNLYPMNNNADDAILSDGTPAIESTTFWAGIKYQF